MKDTDWVIDKMHFARPSKLQVAYGRRSRTTLLCLGMTKGILPSYQINRHILEIALKVQYPLGRKSFIQNSTFNFQGTELQKTDQNASFVYPLLDASCEKRVTGPLDEIAITRVRVKAAVAG